MLKVRMKKLISHLLVMALVISSFAVGPVNQISWAESVKGDLIISEYVEGSGYNKAIEIFNTSDGAIKLSDYELSYHSKGQAEGEAMALVDDNGAKTIAPSQTFVMYYSRENSTTPAYITEQMLSERGALYNYNTSMSHNGDDSYKLINKTTGRVLDIVGPMEEVNFGKDVTQIRKPSVDQGNTTPGSFLESEWIKKGKNDVSDLGQHAFDGIMPENKLSQVYHAVGDAVVEAGTTITLMHEDKDADIYYSTESDEKSDFVQFTEPIEINEDTIIRAFAKKDGMLDSDVVQFKYTLLVKDTISNIRNNDGELAIIEGVVTGKVGSYDYYMQDDTAGIILSAYKVKDLSVNEGDKIRVKGRIEVYKTMSQIHPLSIDAVEVISSGHVTSPQLVTSTSVNEETEGELITIKNIEIASVDKYGNYTIKDSEGQTLLMPSGDISLEIGEAYESITGLVKYNYGYKIFTRNADDFVWSTSKVYPVKPSLGDKKAVTEVESGTQIKLSTETQGAQIYFTQGADKNIPDPTPQTGVLYDENTLIQIDEDNLVIKVMAVKEGLEDTPVITYEYKLGEFIYMHTLQGEGHTSPYVNQSVSNVKGIVTAVSFKDNFQKGLYIQTPDQNIDNNIGTSEGIFIKMNDTYGYKTGDLVLVSGEVKEVKNGIYDLDNLETVIENATVTVIASGQALPQAVVLGEGGRTLITDHIDDDGNTSYDPEQDALDYYESLEGMLVKVNDPVVVGMDERYGEFSVLADNGKASEGKRTPYGGIKATATDHNPEIIHIDDVLIPISGSSKTYYDSSFAPKVGDKFESSIEGVMSFGFGKYKVLNTEPLPKLIDGGLKLGQTSIEFNADKLTIASFNIENFHKGVEAEKIERIAGTIALELKSPDVVAVIEMQDNNGATDNGITSANENAAVLIEAIHKLSSESVDYKYVDIAPVDKNEGGEPGGNIRVGYLYNANRVTLNEAPKGSNTENTTYVNGHLTKNPGRVATNNENFESTRRSLAAEFIFKGESVVVIANHLSSKRGDEGEFGPNQPPVKGSEPKRHGQAQAINDFIDTVLKDNENANVVVVGDLNDYEYSETVNLLKGKSDDNVLTNMIDKLPVNERMTYIHNGNSQVLDHILISNNMLQTAQVDIVNANSMVTKVSGRSSDHDPVIVQVSLENAAIPNPDQNEVLTREMFMTLVPKLFGVYDEASLFDIPFDYTDVDENDWFAPFVWYASYQGWTAGMGDGSFGVGLGVSSKTVAVFKLKSAGYAVPDYNDVLNQLERLGVDWETDDPTSVTYGETMALLNMYIPSDLEARIDTVKTLDLSGSEKALFGENDMVYVEVAVENIVDKMVKGDLLINVKYEKNGIMTMKKFSMFPELDLNTAASQTYRIGFETFDFEAGYYDVEVYFWNSLDEQRPIANSKSVEFEIR
ncbi:chitobiase/beta-hexosaminidase C-terminal domain-containing protein [Fusibacter sp. JL216-2]|uniref:chitobiase/beta-hexosaminidase C-terminal domain-containing protein n=1 Tax=Fusibacter sp. JL216-2 TaxID=3071453 RepID=UPI003D32CEF4